MTTASTTDTPFRQGLTLADLLRLEGLTPRMRSAVLVTGGALLTAIAAQLAFTVPWTPVPYTLQTAAVLLVGTALGAQRGMVSMLLYLLIGAIGLPVFAGGAGGSTHLVGPTAGYLVGFVVAATIVGRLAEDGWDRTAARAAGLMLLGSLIIYALGVPVLAIVYPMSFANALELGALVFVPWDLAKVGAAALLLPFAWRLAGKPRD